MTLQTPTAEGGDDLFQTPPLNEFSQQSTHDSGRCFCFLSFLQASKNFINLPSAIPEM